MPSDRDRPCPMTPRDRLIEAAAESLFQLAYLPSTYWRPEWDDVDGGAKDYNRAKAGQVLDALTATPELAGVLARWAAVANRTLLADGEPPIPEAMLVWVCDGCDECEPVDGGIRSRYPCDGPSKHGASVVHTGVYDRLRTAAVILARALTGEIPAQQTLEAAISVVLAAAGEGRVSE